MVCMKVIVWPPNESSLPELMRLLPNLMNPRRRQKIGPYTVVRSGLSTDIARIQ